MEDNYVVVSKTYMHALRRLLKVQIEHTPSQMCKLQKAPSRIAPFVV